MALYSDSPSGVTIDLKSGMVTASYGNDTLLNINQVQGTNFADVFYGSDLDSLEVFRPSYGNDTIDGRGGNNNNLGYYSISGPVHARLAENLVDKYDRDTSGNWYLRNTDTILNNSIQGLRGTHLNDTLTGGNQANDGFERYEGRGGKMANASVLSDKIGMGIHSRITKTKKEDYPYYNTLVVINQPWVDNDMTNPMAQPEIKAKGGESLWLASSLVFLFGKQKKAGINHIDATKNGRKVSFAIRTRISILKNHINGLGYKDGKIIAVPQGYIADTKEALDNYKKEYSQYWSGILSGDGEVNFEESEDEITE
jgi:hypothetical protein